VVVVVSRAWYGDWIGHFGHRCLDVVVTRVLTHRLDDIVVVRSCVCVLKIKSVMAKVGGDGNVRV